jgi:hypothetical protein
MMAKLMGFTRSVVADIGVWTVVNGLYTAGGHGQNISTCDKSLDAVIDHILYSVPRRTLHTPSNRPGPVVIGTLDGSTAGANPAACDSDHKAIWAVQIPPPAAGWMGVL